MIEINGSIHKIKAFYENGAHQYINYNNVQTPKKNKYSQYNIGNMELHFQVINNYNIK